VSSVSISHPGELDLDLVQKWISVLLNEKGTDIFRMKGVLAIQFAEQRFVYQAVHMIFTGNFTEAWGEDDVKESKLVFIGKNLDGAELRASFMACVSNEENTKKKQAALRFKIGDAVQCKTGPGKADWSKGKIVQLQYRDDQMPPGMVAPYQVQLQGGDLIYAPDDVDEIIKKA